MGGAPRREAPPRIVALDGDGVDIVHRGAAEAGAIYVKVDRLDGRAALFEPAPQSEVAERGVERQWTRAHKEEWVTPDVVEARMAREIKFDPDLWLIEVEDRDGRCWLDLTG